MRILFVYIFLALLFSCQQEISPEGYVDTTDGNKLYYKMIGHGEPIIIVHGGPTLDHSYLRPHLDMLAEQYQLIYFDQRVAGKSTYQVDSNSMNLKTLAEDIERIRSALKLGKIHLLAHSFGSVQAQEYAVLFSEQLASLILIAGNGPNPSYAEAENVELGSRMDSTFRMERASLLNSERAKTGDHRFIEEFLKFSFSIQFYDESKLSDLNISLPEDINQRREKLFLLGDNLASYSYERELRQLDIPCLLVYGNYDPASKISGPALNSVLKSSRFHVIPQSGHFPFIERPAEFKYLVFDFLEKKENY